MSEVLKSTGKQPSTESENTQEQCQSQKAPSSSIQSLSLSSSSSYSAEEVMELLTFDVGDSFLAKLFEALQDQMTIEQTWVFKAVVEFEMKFREKLESAAEEYLRELFEKAALGEVIQEKGEGGRGEFQIEKQGVESGDVERKVVIEDLERSDLEILRLSGIDRVFIDSAIRELSGVF